MFRFAGILLTLGALHGAVKLPAIIYSVLFVAYSIYMDKRGGDNVNHSAHLWGAAYGVIFTIALNPAVLPRFIALLSQPRFS